MCGVAVLTLRAVLRVVHGKQQSQRSANRLLSTATQTAVLHFTAKQPTNHRLACGTQRTAIDTKHKLFLTQCCVICCIELMGLVFHEWCRSTVESTPAAGSSVRLRSFLLQCFLMQLCENKTVPALDETSQTCFPCLLIRVSQDQTQRRCLWNCTKSPEKITGLWRKQKKQMLCACAYAMHDWQLWWNRYATKAGDELWLDDKLYHIPGRGLLYSSPACEKGTPAHRPGRTPSDTSDSVPGTWLAPGSTAPVTAHTGLTINTILEGEYIQSESYAFTKFLREHKKSQGLFRVIGMWRIGIFSFFFQIHQTNFKLHFNYNI